MKAALLYIPAMLLSLTACVGGEEAAACGETVPVHFRIGAGSPGSRAATEEEMAVNSLQMMVFDALDSTIVDYRRFDDMSRPPCIRIERNRARIIYAAANVPDDLGDVSCIRDLNGRRVSYTNELPGSLQMMGCVTVCAEAETTVTLALKRFVAKVYLHGYRIRTSCTNNCVPAMKRVALLAIPTECYCDFSEYSGSYHNLMEAMTDNDLPLAVTVNPPEHFDDYGFLTSEQHFTFYGYPNSVQTYGNNKYPRLALVCIGAYHRNNSSATSYCYHMLGLSLPPLESNLEYRVIQVSSTAYGPCFSITPGEHPVSQGVFFSKAPASPEAPFYIEVRDMSTGLLTGAYPIKEVSYYEQDVD